MVIYKGIVDSSLPVFSLLIVTFSSSLSQPASQLEGPTEGFFQ